MRPILFCLLIMLASPALAAPAEDHWGAAAPGGQSEEFTLAANLVKAERFKEALPVLARLAASEPENADVHNLLGFAYRKTGDLERGGAAYARALELDPYHAGALEYQGELFLTLGDLAAAERNLAILRTTCPKPCEEADDLEAAISAHANTQ